MKASVVIIVMIGLLFNCSSPEKKEEVTDHSQHAGKKEDDEKKPLSPRTASMSNIGSNHIHIDYGSPSKRGRMIFGGLVGYGTVWATGAHKATWIDFGQDVTINGVEIEAGKYGLFTIPGQTEWTIIISKDWDMHLADDYNEANDIVRIPAEVQSLDKVVESLTFEVSEIDEMNGQVNIKWDQTTVSFNITNK